MPVALGDPPLHGFDQPLGLLSDCHRRIEHFLDTIHQVLRDTAGGALSLAQREALESALRYFETAAPRHTEDEERSLFPLLRARAEEPELRSALARLEALETDHVLAGELHAQVRHWCRRWLDQGPLAQPQVRRLGTLLSRLARLYRQHILIEDHELFPLAQRLLSAPQLERLGREMALRRGLDPHRLRELGG
ncbi:hemerythrin domain-containing protein [Fontivita pretiosa]|uniref:hemerythrin domain-containing protein n=1 Tax=Fontivita pretiosa TaxID=2989684 RepID=UPI003D16BC6E